ncbi:unnamed protein product [Miscanthus lutarioriparius]|uniref:Uncharacterized protein n=1 Tax=Miscanthus lutarioriparius TaxID=422564 RepID=A0A811S9M6_9POAL|nr:unnamed protein product [Miscanthus lutarioriparius]
MSVLIRDHGNREQHWLWLHSWCAARQLAPTRIVEAPSLRKDPCGSCLTIGSAPIPDLATLTKLGLGALTFNTALAIYNSWGDAGSVAFVLAADAALVLLFLCFREFERGGRGRDAKIKAAVRDHVRLEGGASHAAASGRPRIFHISTLTKLGLGALTFNSALAIYNSWGDAGSVAFVLAADAAFVLLFLCLREFERGGRGRDAKIKAAVWALTTLLTAMFASRVAPLMPPPVAAVVWLLAVATAAGGFWAFFLN